MFVIMSGIHKMLVRIANREVHDQIQSDVGLHCLSRPFWQALKVQNFRIFTISDGSFKCQVANYT